MPVYDKINILGNIAVTTVNEMASVKYSNSGDQAENSCGVEHEIKLVKTNGKWKIIEDDYDNEMMKLYPRGTDWDKMVKEFNVTMKKWRKQDKELEEKLKEKANTDARLKTRLSGVSELPITTQNLRTPDRSKISWYGMQYTDDSGSDSTTYYNKLFKNYVVSGGDCQNFVSQSIWYGFGGQNNSTAINGHYSPMLDENNDPDPHDWWADAYGTDSNWMWTGVDYFKSFIIDNYNNNKRGVQGLVGSLNYTMVGDYIYVPGHVLIIVNIDDFDNDGLTDFNEIYVSAHTSNKNNHRLSDLYDPSQVQYMWIAYYQD